MKKKLPLIVAILLITGSVFSQEKDTDTLYIRYDKFKDQTFVANKHIELKPGNALFNRVEFSAGFLHDGQKPVANAGSFHISFRVHSKEWRFLEAAQRQMILLADSTRIEKSQRRHSGDTSSSRYAGVSVTENLIFVVTRDELASIANAKDVELQIGWLETSLTDEAKRRIKELLAYAAN